MFEQRKIEVGDKFAQAFLIQLGTKSLILIRAGKGYIMCGYLDISIAEKFGDVAARITGVSTIDEALQANIHSCTSKAEAVGIKPGQPVKEALGLIV